jgi:hypothetical protein
MLPPESKWKKRWDRWTTFLVVYNCVAIPLILGFSLYDYRTGIYNPGLMARPEPRTA